MRERHLGNLRRRHLLGAKEEGPDGRAGLLAMAKDREVTCAVNRVHAGLRIQPIPSAAIVSRATSRAGGRSKTVAERFGCRWHLAVRSTEKPVESWEPLHELRAGDDPVDAEELARP